MVASSKTQIWLKPGIASVLVIALTKLDAKEPEGGAYTGQREAFQPIIMFLLFVSSYWAGITDLEEVD